MRFCNRYVKVATTKVSGDGDGDIKVADCLCPFVWELGLFGGFFGAGFGVFFLSFLRGRGGGHFCAWDVSKAGLFEINKFLLC